jgi:hypothetical protein
VEAATRRDGHRPRGCGRLRMLQRRANHERRRPQPSGTAVRDSSALHATTPSRPWVAAPEAAALGDSRGIVVGSACYGVEWGSHSGGAALARAPRGGQPPWTGLREPGLVGSRRGHRLHYRRDAVAGAGAGRQCRE